MNKEDFTQIGTSIESVDLAALLIALEFPLLSCNTVEGVNLDGGATPRKTITWKFGKVSENGKHRLDEVRRKWILPKEFTLDVYQLSRLLAQNLGILKNLSKHPASILWNDFDGIGQLSSRECSKKCKELPISARGFGGICDTSTIALAITLGVIPSAMYMDNGRLHVSFTRTANSVNLDDVIRMLKDPNMRRRDNTNAVATLICQLDNRAEILANIDAMRKKIRLIGDGGETQVMFEQGKLKEKDKAKIKDLFS